ncbi:MAG: NAD(P)H-binding protein [Ornithinimicrobium sp.]
MYDARIDDHGEDSAPLLITGASGTIGARVVDIVAAAGATVRVAARRPAALQDPWERDVTIVPFDFVDESTWGSACKGVKVAFVMRPPAISNIERDMVPALQAMQTAGVEHVVLLSVMGAENMPWVPHAKLEAWLRASTMSWTFVRPSFFMENLSTTHASAIQDLDEIIVPAGKGKTSFVAAEDVAAVAGAALLHPERHRDRCWTPTGAAAYSYTAVAAMMSLAVGRTIIYRRPSIARYAAHARRDLGMPWAMVATTVAIYTVARLGKAGGVTADVEAVTGHRPVRLYDWVSEHRGAWR